MSYCRHSQLQEAKETYLLLELLKSIGELFSLIPLADDFILHLFQLLAEIISLLFNSLRVLLQLLRQRDVRLSVREMIRPFVSVFDLGISSPPPRSSRYTLSLLALSPRQSVLDFEDSWLLERIYCSEGWSLKVDL
jgi:hypothetical protein